MEKEKNKTTVSSEEGPKKTKVIAKVKADSTAKTKVKTKTKAKRKSEFSKILCIAVVAIFTLVAICAIAAYYFLMYLAIEKQSAVTPDAALPIAGITSILAAVLSYCLYQGVLKTSLNKNHLTINDEGVIKPILDELLNKDEE